MINTSRKEQEGQDQLITSRLLQTSNVQLVESKVQNPAEPQLETPEPLKNLFALTPSYSTIINFEKKNQPQKSFFERIPVILPNNWLLITWEIFTFFLLGMFFFIIPVEVFVWIWMGYSQTYYFVKGFNILILVIFIADWIIFANVAVVINGKLILDRKLIMKKYLRVQFWINLITIIIIIFELFIKNDKFKPVSLLIFLRIYNLTVLYNKILKKLYFSRLLRNILQLYTFLLSIYLISHLFACIFIDLSTYSYNTLGYQPTDTWITSTIVYQQLPSNITTNQTVYDCLNNGDWGTPYLYSIWWSQANMLTLGSSIYPQNPWETLATTILQFLAVVQFTFFIGLVINILGSEGSDLNADMQQIQQIHQYLRIRNTDPGLTLEIQTYLSHQLKVKEQEDSLVLGTYQQILSQLTPQLLEELLLPGTQAFSNSIQNIPWVGENFSQNSFQIMEKHLKEVILAKDQKLKLDNDKLYFVFQGAVNVNIPTQYDLQTEGIFIKEIQKGQFFGDENMLIFTSGNYQMQAIESSVLYTLEREKWLEVIKMDSIDYEYFCDLRDQLQFQHRLTNQRCIICSEAHCAEFCYYIQPKNRLNPVQILKRVKNLELEKIEKRDMFMRKQYGRKGKSLKMIKMVQDQATGFKEIKIGKVNKQQTERKIINFQLDEVYTFTTYQTQNNIDQVLKKVQNLKKNQNLFVLY